MLEECGVPYELRHTDIMKGAHKAPELMKLNPMGKLPILTDGDVVVTESAAIGLYLADRYSYGTLAPKADDPKRATYLRWSLFSPSVIEPAMTAKQNKWECKPSQVGWGTPESVMTSIDAAIEGRDFILGSDFSMADVIFGGTVRFMINFKMVEPTKTMSAYAERLGARPACKRADARNMAIMEEHGLKMG